MGLPPNGGNVRASGRSDGETYAALVVVASGASAAVGETVFGS
jgi:hypothetical protein